MIRSTELDTGEIDGPFAKDRVDPRTMTRSERGAVEKATKATSAGLSHVTEKDRGDDEREGVLKARMSGNWVSLLSRFPLIAIDIGMAFTVDRR
jgi:hypothetical protein